MSPEVIICTLVTKNRLGYARVLAQSFKEQHPAGKCFVLLVDNAKDVTAGGGDFDLVTLAELGLAEQSRLCFQFTAFELCNALKPYFLLYLHERTGCSAMIYIDSDMLILDGLFPIVSALQTHPIVLTPHYLTAPKTIPPALGVLPLLVGGVFNAGIVGVTFSEVGIAFLNWWKSMTSTHSLFGDAEGLFVDQKFLDMVPLLFPEYHMLRDIRFNVAYFNLHERKLLQIDGIWYVKGERLAVFHFTCFDFRTASFVGHASAAASQDPQIGDLIQHYTDRLAAAGQQQCNEAGYCFAQFEDGPVILPQTRRLFWNAFIDKNYEGNPFRDRRLQQQQEKHSRSSRPGAAKRIIRTLGRIFSH